MKKTLLEIVQDILSDLSGDEVNSITDTTEAEQVARIVRETYEHIIVKADLPETFGLFELDASGSTSKPVLMTVPSTVDSVQWVKYNCITTDDVYPKWSEMQYIPLQSFLDRMYNLPAETDSTIETFSQTVNGASVDFYYFNDRAPSLYTTIDDVTFIFDAYDSSVDTTLQKNKSLGWGKLLRTFSLTDSYIPDMDANMFPLLMQEAKAQAFNDLRQMDSPRADKRAKEHWVKTQDDKHNTGGRLPYWYKTHMPYNYGRRGFR